jgi:hypothetical protein
VACAPNKEGAFHKAASDPVQRKNRRRERGTDEGEKDADMSELHNYCNNRGKQTGATLQAGEEAESVEGDVATGLIPNENPTSQFSSECCLP